MKSTDFHGAEMNKLKPYPQSFFTKSVEAAKRQKYDCAVTLLNQTLARKSKLE